jgi:hypothetical protein
MQPELCVARKVYQLRHAVEMAIKLVERLHL